MAINNWGKEVQTSGDFEGKSMKVGGGGRFAKLKAKLGKKKGVKDAGAIAASIGRAKYGKKRFAKMGAVGRKRMKK